MCVHSHNFCNFIFSILRYTFWCPIVCPLMLTPCQTKNVCELQAYSTYPPHTRWTSDVLECRGTSCKLGSHSLCNISVFLKIRESLMQQGFPPMVTRATYPDSPFIGQLHWQTFLVRSCKVPPMEPCFPEGAPIEEICRLEVQFAPSETLGKVASGNSDHKVLHGCRTFRNFDNSGCTTRWKTKLISLSQILACDCWQV